MKYFSISALISIVLLFVLSSCSTHKVDNSNKTSIAFAIIKKDKIIFLQDTIALKEKLKTNLFSTNTKINLEKVEVSKQITISVNPKEYYFLLVKDFHKKIKIVRWLNRIGDKLFFNNKSPNEDSFEQMYTTCEGEEDCDPHVFITDTERFWSCSMDPTCKIGIVDEKTIKCKSYKSIIISELED